ncbi:uncharacterized protein LOC129768332 [Toxorhynchites rutilus septentrionalis]|uniref:uncharacterized protein LOC129768332 n=1 Tax=Toxorhynchites rutilus septentrionalis TaxID=329112 RepID=UPI002478BA05|nr:uncharacterized protein LOC129768332 [Toxorhynchites rutilus septentrionalis]
MVLLITSPMQTWAVKLSFFMVEQKLIASNSRSTAVYVGLFILEQALPSWLGTSQRTPDALLTPRSGIEVPDEDYFRRKGVLGHTALQPELVEKVVSNLTGRTNT